MPQKLSPLTNYERETVILFNEDEKTATIFTYNKKWQKHIQERMNISPDQDNSDGGLTYTLPKNTIRLPLVKRTMSPEQKAKMKAAGFGKKKSD